MTSSKPNCNAIVFHYHLISCSVCARQQTTKYYILTYPLTYKYCSKCKLTINSGFSGTLFTNIYIRYRLVSLYISFNERTSRIVFKLFWLSGFVYQSLNMNKLQNILVICCLVGLLNSFVNSCTTPNSGVDGSCRSLQNCEPLKQTLKRRFSLNENYDWQNGPKSTQMTNFLKKYSNLCKNNKVFILEQRLSLFNYISWVKNSSDNCVLIFA